MDFYAGILFLKILILLVGLGQQSSLLDVGVKTLSTHGKVALLQGVVLPQGKAVSLVAYCLNANPVKLQIWRQTTNINNTLQYTLEWEKTVVPEVPFGVNFFPLEEEFNLTSEHRLGLLNVRDPGPVVYTVSHSAGTVFSNDASRTPTLGRSMAFSDFPYPYRFSIAVCNTSGCGMLSTTTQVINPTPKHQVATRIPSTTPSTPSDSSLSSTSLVSDDLLMGVLIWLVALTLLMIIALFFVLFRRLRPRKEETPSTITSDSDSDWYIVVDERNQPLSHNQGPSQQSPVRN